MKEALLSANSFTGKQKSWIQKKIDEDIVPTVGFKPTQESPSPFWKAKECWNESLMHQL
jgi:hypothetical protein